MPVCLSCQGWYDGQVSIAEKMWTKPGGGTLRGNRLDAILLAEALQFADELNGEPVLARHAFGVLPDRITQRLGPSGIVEDAHALGHQIGGHAGSITETGQGPNDSNDDHPVVARQDASDAVSVAGQQRGHRTLQCGARGSSYTEGRTTSPPAVAAGRRPLETRPSPAEPLWFRLGRVMCSAARATSRNHARSP